MGAGYTNEMMYIARRISLVVEDAGNNSLQRWSDVGDVCDGTRAKGGRICGVCICRSDISILHAEHVVSHGIDGA